MPKVPVRSFDDFGMWYTPGVADPCRAIAQAPDAADIYTNRANTIVVLSDGSRVLGRGDIGPEAGLPVMEGKALLFKLLGESTPFHSASGLVSLKIWYALPS